MSKFFLVFNLQVLDFLPKRFVLFYQLLVRLSNFSELLCLLNIGGSIDNDLLHSNGSSWIVWRSSHRTGVKEWPNWDLKFGWAVCI